MEEKKRASQIPWESEDRVEGQGPDVLEESPLDIQKKYRKNYLKSLDQRFVSILAGTLIVISVIVIYLSHQPVQKAWGSIQRVQERIASFVFQQPVREEKPVVSPPERPEETTEVAAAIPVGEEAVAEAAEPGAEATPGAPEEPYPGTPEERMAARMRTREEISREVSSKGILGLLTGVGVATEGEGVVDVLASSAGEMGQDLDEVLSGLTGLKSARSAAEVGVGRGGRARSVRGGRVTGPADISALITGLGTAKTKGVKRKGEVKIISPTQLKAEKRRTAGRKVEDVLSVINDHYSAIEYCYRRALRKNPDLKGKVSIRFTINPDGSVGSVEILSSTLNSPEVERCIVSKMKRWRDFGAVDPKWGVAVFRQDFIFGY